MMDFRILDYPVQLARFRGVADSIVELDLYSEVPSDRLVNDRAELKLGVFLHAGPEHAKLYEHLTKIKARAEPQAVTYSFPLLPGQYTFSVEARAPDGSVAVNRERVELKQFPDGSLTMSDLVLARGVAPRVEEPTDRRDFAINVNRTLKYDTGELFAAYWEVYGLKPDVENFANYLVTISVTDAEGRGVLAKLVGAVGELFGLSGEQGIELAYERLVELKGDRVPEYVSLELATDSPGEYRLRVEVADRGSGHTSVSERTFLVIGK